MICLVDGQVANSIDVHDRGLSYGDGLFETIALRGHRLLALEAHLARLYRDSAALGISLPENSVIVDELARLTQDTSDAVVKILVTRGSGGRGYKVPPEASGRRVLTVQPWPEYLTEMRPSEIHAFVCQHRLGDNPAIAGMKHLNRLDQVLASRAWPDSDPFEGLMLDQHGSLIEGTRTNVFARFGDSLVTPELANCGVRGVIRQAVLDWCRRHAIAVQIRQLMPAELAAADEIFLTNSIIGVRALASVEGMSRSAALQCDIATVIAAALRADGVIP
jgi:4-amino-4-deoxychorismate lyase